ncbi:MAG TPA: methyltransferase, partial [Acetobacteraceae bacterium]|nr:methyltransferase [Acetobacteraceae bacterium]
WLRANRYFGDHIEGGDAGLYDLLLNPRDRAYTVQELACLLEGEGLRITCWMEPMRYDPAVFLPDPKLRARVAALAPIERAGLAEALCGNMSTHVVYCVRAAEARPEPDPMRPDAVPVAREIPAPELARSIRPDGTLPFLFDGLRVPVPLPPLAGAILNLIDGQRTVAELLDAVQGKRASAEAAARAWQQTYGALSRVNRILLAAP